jgi:hypothetical protein
MALFFPAAFSQPTNQTNSTPLTLAGRMRSSQHQQINWANGRMLLKSMELRHFSNIKQLLPFAYVSADPQISK